MMVQDAQDRFESAQKLMAAGYGVKRPAKAVGVSQGWLHRRVNGRCAVNAKNGPKPVLRPDEEQALADAVIHRASAGYGVTKKDLREKVKLVASDGRTTPWGAAGPGKKWVSLFLKRRGGQVSVRKTRILDSNRRAAGNREEVEAYFEAVREVLDEHDIPPARMFNCDGTGRCALFMCMHHYTQAYTTHSVCCAQVSLHKVRSQRT
jgi:hypothetical protein